MKSKIQFLVLLLFAPFAVKAQVIINELSAANFAGGGTIDNYSSYQDWIELYNTSPNAVDLSGYYLSDNENNPTKWQIPNGVTINGNGFLVIYASGRDEYLNGNLHTNFKITQAKQEGAVLANPSGNIIDSYMLIIPNQRNHSRGRTTDGSNDWAIFTTPTPGAPNANPKNEYPLMEINTEAGVYQGSVTVSMTPITPNSKIRYTTDGSEPIETSLEYSGPINVTSTTVIRARAFSNNANTPPGFIHTSTYFIDVNHTMPIVSVSGTEILTLLNGSQIKPIGYFELFDVNGVRVAHTGGDYNKHGNDSWAYAQRGLDYITQDEFGYGNELEYKIFRNKSRTGFQRLILKAGANDNYPFENGGAHIRDPYVQSLSQIAGLRLDERTYEPCVLYANGQYWGLYELREKTDDYDFTGYYYNQGQGQLDYLKTWGSTNVKYGSMAGWNELRDFILANDMTVQANYEYVKEKYNHRSLIDYFIINTYIVCADWLNWNTGWWRGLNPSGTKKKWRYTLWDMDATFGHYTNYTGIPDQSANAGPCDPEALGNPGNQGHIPIWNKLIENEEFFAEYINRYSELAGGHFKCENLHAHLDSLITLITPEMPAQIARWGGTFSEWQNNVQQIHDFIEERCQIINDGFLDCYPQLEGPYPITLLVDPPLSGTIETPSMNINQFPFSTDYFGGIQAKFKAKNKTGYLFSHWTSNGTVINPDELNEEITVSFTTGDTLVAHFVEEEILMLTLNVVPEQKGSITLNDNTYTSFPIEVEVPASAVNSATATPINGWKLKNWTSTFDLNQPVNTNPISFTLDQDGNLTAYFEEILFNVTFNIQPQGIGVIIVDGDTLHNLAQTISVPGDVPIKVKASTEEEFFEFSHWTSNHAAPMPNENVSTATFTFSQTDVVIAHFNEVLNYPVIIECSPPETGYVELDGNLIKTFPFHKNVIGNKHIPLKAMGRGKYGFSHWEVAYGMSMTYPKSQTQNYRILGPTKLIAHFKERFHDVYIPTSFTPNGDGVNDVFKIVGREIDESDFKLVIMSRSGQKVFSTNDIHKGWNGSVNDDGYYAAPGVYVYLVRYVNSITNEPTEKMGTITLIR